MHRFEIRAFQKIYAAKFPSESSYFKSMHYAKQFF